MNLFDRAQQRRAMELIESLPWDDIDASIRIFEEALCLAMEATRDDLLLWERESERRYGGDEFAVDHQQLKAMSPEWKLAYVARLIRSLGLAYGISTDLNNRVPSLHDHGNSPASLLRGLNDIFLAHWWVPG